MPLLVALALSPAAFAQTVPETVAAPLGINLGGTSFQDGFGGTEPGWVWINYLRHYHNNAIRDARGDDSPAFAAPKIYTNALLSQAIYTSSRKLWGGALAFNVIVPLVQHHASFAADSPVRLSDNGVGVGDVSFGPSVQMAPVIDAGRPVFVQRFGIDALAPVGGFNRDRNVNQSTGYWSLVPYWAFTVQPTANWEISGRLHYLYNFRTNRAAGVVETEDFRFRNGQAGDAMWLNFASSVGVAERMRVGVSGFYLKQLRDNETNGLRVAGSKRTQFYAGPSLQWRVGGDIFNFNVYLPIEVKNAVAGNSVNLMYVHPLQ